MNADTINRLLKNELSSVETYQQVLDKFGRETGHETEVQRLNSICQEHQDAVSKLENAVQSMGETPASSSGVWGTWSQVVTGGAKLFGDTAALKALKEGEESGAKDYEQTMQETDLPSDIRQLIQTTLLPRQQSHISSIDQLLGMQQQRRS